MFRKIGSEVYIQAVVSNEISVIKDPALRYFWIEFSQSDWKSIPSDCRLGIGVTASSVDDALEILRHGPFKETALPISYKLIEDVKITELDQKHVVPNMKPPVFRGIWFPASYFVEVVC